MAIHLDGVSTGSPKIHITSGRVPSTYPVTYGGWHKITDTPTSGYFQPFGVGKVSNSSHMGLRFNTLRRATFWGADNSTPTPTLDWEDDTGFACNENEWYHVAIIGTSVSSNRSVISDIHGSQYRNYNYTTVNLGTCSGWTRFAIGACARSSYLYVSEGHFAECFAFDVALSVAEVDHIRQHGVLSLTHRLGNLIYYLPLWGDETEVTYGAVLNGASVAVDAGARWTAAGEHAPVLSQGRFRGREWVFIGTASVTLYPTVVSATGSVLVPSSITTKQTLSPSLVTTTAEVLSPSSIDYAKNTVSPSTVSVTAEVLTPSSVDTKQTISATLVSTTAVVLDPPSITYAKATVSPSVISTTAEVLEPSSIAYAKNTISPTLVSATAEVLDPNKVDTKVPISASLVSVTAEVLDPIQIKTTLSPAIVSVTGEVIVPSIFSKQTISPSIVTSLASVLTPDSIFSGSIVTPTAVSTTAEVLVPTIDSKVTVSPSVVTATAEVLSPSSIIAGATINAPLVSATADVLVPSSILVQQTISPSIITTTAEVIIPFQIQDDVNEILPTVVSATGVVFEPTAILEFGQKLYLPPVVIGKGYVITPNIPLPIKPSVLVATGEILVPSIYSKVSISPTIIAATGDVLTPSISASKISISPSIVSAQGEVIEPDTIFEGGLTLIHGGSAKVTREDRYYLVPRENRVVKSPYENRTYRAEP